MIEIFSVVTVLVSFLFLWLAMRLKDTWATLQILFVIIAFAFLGVSGAMIAVTAISADTIQMAWSFMWFNILMLIVVTLSFTLFLIKNVLEAMNNSVG